MNKLNKLLLLVLSLSLTVSESQAAPSQQVENQDYSLQQVFAFSRHGLRAPLAAPGSVPFKASAREWPTWDTPSGVLTPNGGIVEMRMGHYFKQWLVANNLLSAKGCPTAEEVYLSANSIQRTVATGQYFSVAAFPGCNVSVDHKMALNNMEPLYLPFLSDPTLKQKFIKAIEQAADKEGLEGFNKKFAKYYKTLEDLIQFDKSEYCLKENVCKLTDLKSSVDTNKAGMFDLKGPMGLGDAISEIFLLQYYEGFPLDQVAWGENLSPEEWQRLADIKSTYHSLAFGTPEVAKHTSRELLQYIYDTVKHDNTKPKFHMAFGHDVNVATILDVLQIKSFRLPGQYERTPVSGKIVFERWQDNKTGEQKLKIEYIYQTRDQIRNREVLNLDNPAQHMTLEMAECPIDKNGFCSLADFEKFMQKVLAD